MPVWFNPARELDALLRKVAPQVAGLDSQFDPELRPSDPRHADFQANGVLAAAKRAKQNPRTLATALLEAVRASGELANRACQAEMVASFRIPVSTTAQPSVSSMAHRLM